MATGEPTFHVTGESLEARRSFSGKTPRVHGGASLQSDATSINGSTSLDASNGGSLGQGGFYWPGNRNVPDTQDVSIVFRPKFYGVSPGQAYGLFSMGGPHRALWGWLGMYHSSSSDLRTNQRNENGQNGINGPSYTHGLSANVWYDFLFTFTGTTATNGFKLYINGSNVVSYTTTRPWTAAPRAVILYSFIAYGLGENLNNGYSALDELAQFPGIIDPNNVTFRDGTTGALNGASRTKYLASTPFDGLASTGGRVIKDL